VPDAERLAHRNRHHEAARLERAGRQAAFVFDDDLAAAEFLAELGQANQRRGDFAEADNIGAFAHRQQLAIAPQVGRALPERVFCQRLLHPGEVVAHQERFPGFGKVVDLIGGIAIAFHRAFEVGHERRTFDGQIVVVFHR